MTCDPIGWIVVEADHRIRCDNCKKKFYQMTNQEISYLKSDLPLLVRAEPDNVDNKIRQKILSKFRVDTP